MLLEMIRKRYLKNALSFIIYKEQNHGKARNFMDIKGHIK